MDTKTELKRGHRGCEFLLVALELFNHGRGQINERKENKGKVGGLCNLHLSPCPLTKQFICELYDISELTSLGDMGVVEI